MNVLRITSLILIFVFLNIKIQGQEKTTVIERTPEQEAAKQTERIQKEIKLSTTQLRQIHEINLKYARERQVSNSRAEALERIKNKDADFKRILNANQYQELKNKKYENTIRNSSSLKRTSPSINSSSRSTTKSTNYRTVSPTRSTNNNSSSRSNESIKSSRSGNTSKSSTIGVSRNTGNTSNSSTGSNTSTNSSRSVGTSRSSNTSSSGRNSENTSKSSSRSSSSSRSTNTSSSSR